MNEEKESIKLLKECEDVLDYHNSQFASREHYCLLCLSNTYNGGKGIIHRPNCLIVRLRRMLNKND